MKRLLIGISAAATLLATGAFAADLAVKQPVYTKAPVYAEPVFNWTGFYVGGNLGYSWGNSDNTVTLSRFDTGAVLPNGTVLSSNHVDGVIGGGQFGYNWQISNWLAGFEADIQGSGERGSSLLTCVGCADDGTNITSSLTQKLEWFGTVRGRLGILATPSILLYGTGGLAYGELKLGGSVTGNTAQGVPTTIALLGTSSTRVGWTAGAGIEGVIGHGWTAKLEYLYMDLGSLSGGPEQLTGILVNPRRNAGVAYSSSFTDNIVRAGVNYHFGGPVVAKY